jgi:alcohol dehydrogenase (cytochrome c)
MRALLMIVLCSVTLAAQTAAPLVTSQDLLDGLKDPTRWLTYSGDYNGQRHSPLTQLTPENVNQLTAGSQTVGSFAVYENS